MPWAATCRTDPKRRTLRLDGGRIAAVVPLALLVAGGATWAGDLDAPQAPVSVAVPSEAVRLWSGASGQALEGALGFQRVPGGAGPVVGAPGSAGVQQVSSDRWGLDPTGIPVRALEGYRLAEQLLAVGDPSCHLDWALVAAIGRVESAHGSFAGNRLGPDGVARPGIVGVPLDGSGGTARITDSDGGRWDGDGLLDRAVGPMQFIPVTWRTVGVDADGDGRSEPQDIDDAATATGVYLCSGSGDLRSSGDRYRAVYRYNHSDEYVRTVLAIADAYARGSGIVPDLVRPGDGSQDRAERVRRDPPPAPARPGAAADLAPAPGAGTPPATAPPTPAQPPAPTPGPTPGPPDGPTDPPASAPEGVVAGVVGAVRTLLPPPPVPPPPAPAPTTPPVTAPPLVPGVTCLLDPALGSLLPLCPPTPTP